MALVLTSLTGYAQHDFQVVRGNCMPAPEGETVAGARSSKPYRLRSINRNWDPTRVYKQLVILVEFKGDSTYFQMENPKAFHDDLFNTSGFNQRNGKGCVADYFRDQSNGLLNLQFDVYGPYVLDQKAQPYSQPTDKTRNYGRNALVEATKMFLAENPELDFSQYDWDNNGKVTQVIFVFAGAAGNMSAQECLGYLWPNTSAFSSITTHDGFTISDYTCSAEKWHPNYSYSCGLGTICHEFAHSLGLPDIYPTTSGAGFSVCDEWDLMDGGNFTNYGWCPPNFTAFEKYLLGWTSLYKLDEPATVKDMKPLSEGGEALVVCHTNDEFLLLENRQHCGWDACAPGKGLVIYHVHYNASVWNGNTVNNNADKRRFELVHADNLDYDGWDNLLYDRHANSWAFSGRIHNYHLSTSPYPWTTDSTDFVNNELTDTSVPAPKMNCPNDNGDTFLHKPITNIQMTEDGLISFDFMGGDQTGIENLKPQTSARPKDACYQRDARNLQPQTYDLQGRSVSGAKGRGIYIQRQADGTIKKCLNKLYIY